MKGVCLSNKLGWMETPLLTIPLTNHNDGESTRCIRGNYISGL